MAAGAWQAAHEILSEGSFKLDNTDRKSSISIEKVGLLLICCAHMDHDTHLTAGAAWFRSQLLSKSTMTPEEELFTLYHVARDAAERGRYDEARSLLARIPRIAASAAASWGLIYAQLLKSLLDVREGLLASAEEAALHATTLAEGMGSDVVLGDALIGLGSVLRFQRRLEAAHKIYARAASCYWRAGDFRGRSAALFNRAALVNAQGFLQESRGAFEEALAAGTACGREITALRARLGLGWVAARSGDSAEARRRLLPAWRDARRRKVPREEALALEYLAEADILAGRLVQARVAVRACQRLATRLAPQGDIAIEIKIKNAMLLLAQGDPGRAAQTAFTAARAAQKANLIWEEAQACHLMGIARLYGGQKKQRAMGAFRRSLMLLKRMDEQLERKAVEAWLEALEHPYGWLPRRARIANARDEQAGSPAGETDAPESASGATAFWLEHPLLGPHAWLRQRAGLETLRLGTYEVRSSAAPLRPSAKTSPAPAEIPRQRSSSIESVVGPSSEITHSSPMKPIAPVWSELGLVSRTPAVLETLRLAEMFAASSIPVLILGETGTGKDLVAQAVHRISGRSGSFVAVNCAAAHRELFGAELFGSRRGAFTGSEHREGLIREAQGGTLFLDEIADLDRAAQGYLLRFLDSGEVRPLGESRSFHVETRIVAATCRNLRRLVAKGRLRKDLYARLAAAVVEIPPLRRRQDDIELLLEFLWRRHKGQADDLRRLFTPSVLRMMRELPWPGNVRDLVHLVAQTVLFVQAGDTSEAIRNLHRRMAGARSPGRKGTPATASGLGGGQQLATGSDIEDSSAAPLVESAEELPRKPAGWLAELPLSDRRSPAVLRRVLSEAGGSVSTAAKLLGISRAHAYRLFKNLDAQ